MPITENIPSEWQDPWFNDFVEWATQVKERIELLESHLSGLATAGQIYPFQYVWTNSVTTGPITSAGVAGVDAAGIAGITELHVNAIDDGDGKDLGNFFAFAPIDQGTTIVVQDKQYAGSRIFLDVTGQPVATSNYWTIPVVPNPNYGPGTLPVNGETVVITYSIPFIRP